MSILQNAIDSIILGVEDYQMADDKRIISSTRNLLAGILLLFKHKLSELSPDGSDEALIKKKTKFQLKDGSLTVIGDGTKTVDFDEIINRFNDLGISGIEWKRLRQIQQYRNNIEHYYTSEPKESAKTMLSDCFIVIRDFIENTLQEDTRTLLGEETWQFLIGNSEVHEAERQQCLDSLQFLIEPFPQSVKDSIKNYRCDNCQSDLIFMNDDDEITCKVCSELSFDRDDFIEVSLTKSYSYWHYDDEPSLVQCPYCFKETYLVFEDKCMVCDEVMPSVCDRCGLDIPIGERGDTSLCGYCHHILDKDDD